MDTTTLLERYEFSIMPTDFLISMIETKNSLVATHLPLMRVNIDFKEGQFCLDGDWQFLVSANKYARPQWFTYHKGRVRIEVAMYPSCPINLSEPSANGLVVPVDGIIKDGSSISSCSGMVLLDKVNSNASNLTSGWIISFYLYDYQVDECEIKFRLPVYLSDANAANN